jgi:hypothetical protein
MPGLLLEPGKLFPHAFSAAGKTKLHFLILKIQTIAIKIKGTFTNVVFLDVPILTHEEYYIFSELAFY